MKLAAHADWESWLYEAGLWAAQVRCSVACCQILFFGHITILFVAESDSRACRFSVETRLGGLIDAARERLQVSQSLAPRCWTSVLFWTPFSVRKAYWNFWNIVDWVSICLAYAILITWISQCLGQARAFLAKKRCAGRPLEHPGGVLGPAFFMSKLWRPRQRAM